MKQGFLSYELSNPWLTAAFVGKLVESAPPKEMQLMSVVILFFEFFFLILFNVEIPLSHMNEWLSFVYWRLSRNLSRFKFSYTNFIKCQRSEMKISDNTQVFETYWNLDWPRNQSCQQKCTFSFKIYFDIVVVKIGTCCRCGNSRSKIEKKRISLKTTNCI